MRSDEAICSHCLEVKPCRVVRIPKPAKAIDLIGLDASTFPVFPESSQTICGDCYEKGSMLIIPDALDAEFIE